MGQSSSGPHLRAREKVPPQLDCQCAYHGKKEEREYRQVRFGHGIVLVREPPRQAAGKSSHAVKNAEDSS
jgi:hypothetical protein